MGKRCIIVEVEEEDLSQNPSEAVAQLFANAGIAARISRHSEEKPRYVSGGVVSSTDYQDWFLKVTAPEPAPTGYVVSRI